MRPTMACQIVFKPDDFYGAVNAASAFVVHKDARTPRLSNKIEIACVGGEAQFVATDHALLGLVKAPVEVRPLGALEYAAPPPFIVNWFGEKGLQEAVSSLRTRPVSNGSLTLDYGPSGLHLNLGGGQPMPLRWSDDPQHLLNWQSAKLFSAFPPYVQLEFVGPQLAALLEVMHAVSELSFARIVELREGWVHLRSGLDNEGAGTFRWVTELQATVKFPSIKVPMPVCFDPKLLLRVIDGFLEEVEPDSQVVLGMYGNLAPIIVHVGSPLKRIAAMMPAREAFLLPPGTPPPVWKAP